MAVGTSPRGDHEVVLGQNTLPGENSSQARSDNSVVTQISQEVAQNNRNEPVLDVCKLFGVSDSVRESRLVSMRSIWDRNCSLRAVFTRNSSFGPNLTSETRADSHARYLSTKQLTHIQDGFIAVVLSYFL